MYKRLYEISGEFYCQIRQPSTPELGGPWQTFFIPWRSTFADPVRAHVSQYHPAHAT